MAKNIVVFFDATGQGRWGLPSNVFKLFRMLERSADQVAFYDSGIATGWRKIPGALAGLGISQNIIEGYEFIFANYDEGDRIFLFGSSRGATTVRSLSGFIQLIGGLRGASRELIRSAYRIYRTRARERRESRAREFAARHGSTATPISFLGVWDTVRALGIPIRAIDVVLENLPFLGHRFHDLRLSPCVDSGYHALAIDEDRRAFRPTLWDRPALEHQTVRQVWFCGAHTDVGGGFEETGLSDLALEWMLANAVASGLRIDPEHPIEIRPDPDGVLHEPRSGLLGWLYRREVRSWSPATHGNPVVHASALRRTRNRRNEPDPPYAPWILDGSLEYEVDAAGYGSR